MKWPGRAVSFGIVTQRWRVRFSRSRLQQTSNIRQSPQANSAPILSGTGNE